MRSLRRTDAVVGSSVAALTLALAVAPALAALASLAALAPGSPVVSSCAGAGSSRATLVVEHGDGSVVTRCVAFDAASVTGEQLLESSGVAWSAQTFGGFGDAVCAMDGEPAHYATCPGKDSYWAVFVSRPGGSWQFASAGISTLALADGDAEGFRYVPAVGTPVGPPLPTGVCPAAIQSAGLAASAGETGGPATTPHAPAGKAAGSAGVAPVAATMASAASPGVVAAASGSVDPLVVVASAKTGGDSSGPPAGNASPDAGPLVSSRAPGPKPGSGVDFGLLAAAVVGGGLGGLALLRLLMARRAAS